MEPRL